MAAHDRRQIPALSPPTTDPVTCSGRTAGTGPSEGRVPMTAARGPRTRTNTSTAATACPVPRGGTQRDLRALGPLRTSAAHDTLGPRATGTSRAPTPCLSPRPPAPPQLALSVPHISSLDLLTRRMMEVIVFWVFTVSENSASKGKSALDPKFPPVLDVLCGLTG